MPGTRKRLCRLCRRWFYPDPRAGDRQRACSKPDCQTARRQKTQANWRAQDPGYAAAYRIDQRHLKPDPDPLRVPAPFDRLPWDLAKDQFGGQGADFIALVCMLLRRSAKDQSTGYPIDPKRVLNNNPVQSQKTSPPLAHTETRAQAMQQLEFHQLDGAWSISGVRHPARFRHLLASLAETGQQTPTIVIPTEQIDGHQRIAALKQLRRDTVEALILDTMSQAEALL